jgi:hypothetical protein
MSSSAHARTANAMVGAGSLCMVIAGIAAISPDVRIQVTNAIGDPAGQLGATISYAMHYGDLALRMARHYGGDNTPLAGFGLIAVFLAFLMFRS